MKIITLLPLFFCTLLSLNGQKMTHLKEMGLLGNVKSLTEKGFSAGRMYGQVVKTNTGAIGGIWNFNRIGNIIDKNSYKIDGTPYYSWEYTYDIHGNAISLISYRCKEKINSSVDQITSIQGFSEETSSVRNRDKEEIEYDCRKSIDSKIKKKYSAENQIIKEEQFTSRNELRWTTTYYYSDLGFCTEQNGISPTKGLYTKLKFKYDELGNQTEVITDWTDGQSLDKKIINEYNKDNQKMKIETYNHSGEMVTQEYRKYDDFENLIESTSTNLSNKKKTIIINQYSYDKNGNWISRTSFLNDRPINIIERELTYYK